MIRTSTPAAIFARSWLLGGEAFDRDVALATLTRLWAQAIGLTDSQGR